MRRIDSCVTQRKAQGPSRTCNDSKEEDEEEEEEEEEEEDLPDAAAEAVLDADGARHRVVPIGTALNLRIITSQKCAAVPRQARF